MQDRVERGVELLLRLARASDAADRVAGEVPLRHARALLSLLGSDGLTVGQLSHAVGLSLPRTSRLVDQLVQTGHVERERGERDRRVVRVRLTRWGRPVARRLFETRASAVEAVLTAAGPDRAEAFVGVLEAVVARLEE